MFGGHALDAGFIKLSETLVVDATPSTLVLFALKLCFWFVFFCACRLKYSFQSQLSLTAKIVCFLNNFSLTYTRRPSNIHIYRNRSGILQNFNFYKAILQLCTFFATPCTDSPNSSAPT